jgi:putative heme-binding domain-containing protein
LPGGTTGALREIVASARSLAEDKRENVENRARAIVIAATGEPSDVEGLVYDMVSPSQPQLVQSAAVWAAAQSSSRGAWQELFRRWPSHTRLTREAMLNQALRSPGGTDALIRALEDEIISVQELSASMRRGLRDVRDESLRRRIEPILDSITPDDRQKILARYADVVSRRGDATRGAAVFKQHCQTCHAMQGIGQQSGPDLASVAARQNDLLLADILDPSGQLTPDYVSYVVVTKEGRILSGMIAAETADSVTLRREEGQQDTIPRSNIDEFRSTGKSLMPDGLEQQLTPDQMADLLEYLHYPNHSP